MRFIMLMMPDVYQGEKGCREGPDFRPSPEAVLGMRGEVNFIGKLIHFFIDMDGMAGKDFEQGLENLKSHLEN